MFCNSCINLPSTSKQTSCRHYDTFAQETAPIDYSAPNDDHRSQFFISNSDKNFPNQSEFIDNNACTASNEISAKEILKVGAINVCGLKTRMNYPEFTKLIQKYDIVCVSETKLDKYDIIECKDYTFYSKPRTEAYKRKSGGIGFFVHSRLIDRVVTLESDCEYIFWLKLSISNHNEVVIGAIYIPPETSSFYNADEFHKFETEVSNKCTSFENVMLTGDANSYTSDLLDFTETDVFITEMFEFDNVLPSTHDPLHLLNELKIPLKRVSKCSKVNRSGLKLIEMCKQNNMFILNGRYGKDRNPGSFTFRNLSVIDYSICSGTLLKYLTNFEVIELDSLYSDGHAFLFVELALEHQRFNLNPNSRHPNNSDSKKYTRWQEELKNEFKHNIDDKMLSDISESLNSCPGDPKLFLSEVVKKLSDLFVKAAKTTFVSKTRRTNILPLNHNSSHKEKPWFGHQCNKARNAYNYARKAYQLHKCSLNRSRLKKASVHYKQTMNTYLSKHRYTTEKKLRNMSTTKPKDYWNFINKLNSPKQHKSPSIDEFFNYFKNSNQQINDDEITPDTVFEFTPSEDSLEALNGPVLYAEIEKAISKTKNGKAPSNFDNILNEYMKCTKEDFIPIYCKLFNIILDTGVIPSDWLVGTIKPIFKNKGSSTDAQNYRPITILSCLGKLFTSILNDRISKFLDANEMLCENQAGFRSGYSTCDHIFTINYLIQKLKSEKKKLYCSFIDFSAAFDSIWRAGLWQKLLKTGIEGKTLNVIKNMYSDIKSCVSLDGNVSEMFSSSRGVRQGENLSPILFSLYLNDLETCLSQSTDGININAAEHYLKLLVLLYADDTVIFSDDKNKLQNCLDAFNNYCLTWKLNVNYSKTKIIVFGSRKNLTCAFNINGNPIEIVEDYKYLGVIFKSNGSFLQCRKHLISQANKALFHLYVKINNIALPIDLQLKLFDHTIMPILTYGSEIWGYENLDMIEDFHCNFLRRITNSKKSTPRYMLYGELCRKPIEIYIKTRMIKYWVSLVQAKQSKIAHIIYKKMSEDSTNNKWLLFIKSILNTTGYYNLWLNQNTALSKTTHILIKTRLIDQFTQNWHANLLNSSKGEMYLTFKDNTCYEHYLNKLPYALRLSMFHYRTGNHRLPVETGRWKSSFKPHNMRKCALCDTQDIGDEMHYLLICPFFRSQRTNLLSEYYYVRPNIIKFKKLMNSDNSEILTKLAVLMKHIIKEFKPQNKC